MDEPREIKVTFDTEDILKSWYRARLASDVVSAITGRIFGSKEYQNSVNEESDLKIAGRGAMTASFLADKLPALRHFQGRDILKTENVLRPAFKGLGIIGGKYGRAGSAIARIFGG